jgi:hypothetical protein
MEIDGTIYLLALERTGWRRWVFGRWVYSSEPFRRDIQRELSGGRLKIMRPKNTQYFPPQDAKELEKGK